MTNTNHFQFSGPILVALIKRWILIALGVGIAAHVVEGINYDSGWTLFLAVLALSVLNVVLKPILILFTLPFIVLTFGLGIWVINALLFVVVGKFLDGFSVQGFSSALWGALIVSLVSLLAETIFRSGKGGRGPGSGRSHRDRLDKNDAIDI